MAKNTLEKLDFKKEKKNPFGRLFYSKTHALEKKHKGILFEDFWYIIVFY